MKSVRFIHGADLHLDSPMIGLKHLPKNIFKRLQESTFHAYRNLIQHAIHHEVDFVILAGDLFDHEDRSIRAQIQLRKGLELLREAGIEVFLLHGNHDYITLDGTKIEMPKNVHVFGEKVEVKSFETTSGASIHLYGFSYPERHVYTRKIDDYHMLQGADFHIGILHGNLEGNVDHGNYAPFQLRDLHEKDFHYWALGHIHKREILSENPPIVYPGNTQGRHKKEKDVKGCYLVSLTEVDETLQFLETSDCIWLELEVDASEVKTFEELYDRCLEVLFESRQEGKGLLVSLNIKNLTSSIDSKNVDELLDSIQEEEKEEDSFVWPIEINIQEAIEWKREELSHESDFYSELFSCFDHLESIEDYLAPLYKHQSARKFLSLPNGEDVEKLKKEAENLLIEKLLRNV